MKALRFSISGLVKLGVLESCITLEGYNLIVDALVGIIHKKPKASRFNSTCRRRSAHRND